MVIDKIKTRRKHSRLWNPLDTQLSCSADTNYLKIYRRSRLFHHSQASYSWFRASGRGGAWWRRRWTITVVVDVIFGLFAKGQWSSASATLSSSDRFGCSSDNLPFVIGQLFLEHKHLSLEFVPLLQDIPQLLQGEAGLAHLLLQAIFVLLRLLFSRPALCTKYRIAILPWTVWTVWQSCHEISLL